MEYLAIIAHLISFYMLTVNGAGVHVSSHGNRVRRVVNGETTDIQQYPYQVQILRDGELVCGGSIISDDWILTAAHCINGASQEDFTIMTGSTEAYEGKEHKIKRIVSHEDYSTETVYNDIAVMQVDTPLTCDEYTLSIEMVGPGVELEEGTHVTVTGWGYTEQDGEVSDVLRKASLFTVSNEECREIYDGVYDVIDSQLCATYADKQKGSCQGDSGGPLITDDYILAGVVSMGRTCADPEHPALYTKVSHYRQWVNNITGV